MSNQKKISGLLNISAVHIVVQHVEKHLKKESFKQVIFFGLSTQFISVANSMVMPLFDPCFC